MTIYKIIYVHYLNKSYNSLKKIMLLKLNINDLINYQSNSKEDNSKSIWS